MLQYFVIICILFMNVSSILLKAKSLFFFFLQILCMHYVAIFCDYLCVVYECVFPSPVSPRQSLDRHCPAFLLIQFSIIKWFVFVFLFVYLYSCIYISFSVLEFIFVFGQALSRLSLNTNFHHIKWFVLRWCTIIDKYQVWQHTQICPIIDYKHKTEISRNAFMPVIVVPKQEPDLS